LSGRGFGLYLNGLGRLNFWGSNADLSLTNRVGDGLWHFLRRPMNGTNVAVYVDGRPAARFARTLNTFAGGFHFMSKPQGFEQLRGEMDNVALFGRALDPVEVEAPVCRGQRHRGHRRSGHHHGADSAGRLSARGRAHPGPRRTAAGPGRSSPS
jgi:hypothetical protein